MTKAVQAQGGVGLSRAALIIWGLLLIVGGYFFVTHPASTAVVFVEIMAIIWLIGGLFDLIDSLTRRGQYWVWRLVGAIVSIVAGLFILANPVLGALFTVQIAFLFIAISALIDGVIGIFVGFKSGGGVRWSTVLLGVAQVIIGIWLLLNPVAAMLALLPAFGLLLIIAGILVVIAAFRYAY